MQSLFCVLLQVFIIVLIVRAVLSWFPHEPGSFLAQASSVAGSLTEWALAPLRSIVPPAGMFDLSFFVLVVGLLILQGAVC
jgi:uncharacterized protein YggT (Ycf19 family)